MFNVVIGSIALGLAILLLVFKKKGRFLTATALIAGLAAAPMIESLLGGVVGALDAAVAVGIALAAATFATAWVVYELKEPGTRSATPWIALATPALWILAAGPFMVLLGLGQGVIGGAGQVVSALTAGG